MHTPFKHVAHHINANPAIYVGHALWSRAVPSSERMRVSGMLLDVSDPLFAFGSDVLDYYLTPQGAQVCRCMASGDRLIKSIDATTAQFATLNTRSYNDPQYFLTWHAISQDANLKTPEEAHMSKRLAILGMPGARLIMMSLLMAADKYSKKAHRAHVLRPTVCFVSARPPGFRVGLSGTRKHRRRSHPVFWRHVQA